MKAFRRFRASALVFGAALIALPACGDSTLPSYDGPSNAPSAAPKATPTAPAPAAPAPAAPATPIAKAQAEPPRALKLADGHIVQLLQEGPNLPTREAIGSWQVGRDTLRVFTRHSVQFKEEPTERMGVAGHDVHVRVIVAHGAREEVALEATASNMLARMDQVDVSVFAALDGEGVRLAIDMPQPAFVTEPEPTESVRARVALRDGRIEVHDRWRGELTALPPGQELLQAAGVPWPKQAVALSVEGEQLVWWNAEWKALHRQSVPSGARVFADARWAFVATPSEVWRIERTRGTALRNRVPLPSVEPALRQTPFHDHRAVVTRIGRSSEGELCVELNESEHAAEVHSIATFAIDARWVARGWLSSSTYENEHTEEAPCGFSSTREHPVAAFDRETCVATFKDSGPSATLSRKGRECSAVAGLSHDGGIVAVRLQEQARAGSDVRLALIDRASGALVVQHSKTQPSFATVDFAPALPAVLSEGWVLDARNGGSRKRLGTSAVWLDASK